MDDNKILKKEIIIKNKQIQELYVLIDTMQTNLRSATSHLSDQDNKKVTGVRSYKWCMNWRAGDELN